MASNESATIRAFVNSRTHTVSHSETTAGKAPKRGRNFDRFVLKSGINRFARTAAGHRVGVGAKTAQVPSPCQRSERKFPTPLPLLRVRVPQKTATPPIGPVGERFWRTP